MAIQFKELLQAVEPLNTMERDLLYQKLIRTEERVLIQRAEQVVEEFNLPNWPPRLGYWMVEDVLQELRRQLEECEQQFGIDSKTFYVTKRNKTQPADLEATKWLCLYEAYHRLRAAKRRFDLKAGLPAEPLPDVKITFRQLTLPEVEERLRQFEQKQGMTSAEFYERYERGEMGDSQETFSWVHAYTAYLHLSGRNGQTEARPA